ncbi:tripartite tricarboxylate transporter substrate binding protein [Alcaligenaceae bacterium]|nr:tripartite tricarboxylate transporter substrate binding protein [Alcaligenaceae bacterium]
MAAFCLAGINTSAQAQAKAFPQQKPVSLVVPYPAGGPSDASARIFSGPISKALDQQVVVENVGGGTGVLGAKRVLNAPPDGYSMLHGSANEVILAPMLNAAAQFKSEDFRLSQPISEATIVLLTREGLKANTLDEFIELARKPGARPLTYGSVGIGSLYHILAEYMAKRVDANFLHIPYRGSTPALQDLVGGQIDFAILGYQTSIEGLVKQGRIKIVTTFSNTLPKPLQHLPRISSSKLLPDFEYIISGGYYVRKETPEPILKQLHDAVGYALEQPDLRERLEAEGRNVMRPISQEEADAYQADQVKRYQEMVRALDFKPM